MCYIFAVNTMFFLTEDVPPDFIINELFVRDRSGHWYRHDRERVFGLVNNAEMARLCVQEMWENYHTRKVAALFRDHWEHFCDPTCYKGTPYFDKLFAAPRAVIFGENI